jgi:cobyrinic acid a,c-diamide synthase
MVRLPRLALATPATEPEPATASLALLAGLAAKRWRVQHFRSRSRPVGSEIVGRITGLPGRHLDAWLMPRDVCRRVFTLGSRAADLAIVEGTLGKVGLGLGPFPFDRPGSLRPLALALDLPVLAVVRCSRAGEFHLPTVPQGVDGILLDGIERPEDFDGLKRLVRLVTHTPVVGAVEALPTVRAELGLVSPTEHLPEPLVARLAESFLRFADWGALRALCESRPFFEPPDAPASPIGRRFRVAYAQDEAFGEYFPDTLETLEGLGADLVEFSPLRDETLPKNVDLVMIGCGFPDRHADALAANLSLIGALRQHVCRGHRIYSEGGGTAYLGRSLVVEGRRLAGAGILPFDAWLRPGCQAPAPVARTLSRDSWLGPAGTVVRGYRSRRWFLRPAEGEFDCPVASGPLSRHRDIYYRHHAVGGLIHLHLAALPHVVAAFAGPHRPSLTLPLPQH